MTLALPSAVTFIALSILGAYAWYRAMGGFKSSRDYLIEIFMRLAGHAPEPKLPAQRER